MYIDVVWYGGLEAPEYLLFTWSLNRQRGSAWVREAKINLAALPCCKKGITIRKAVSCNSALRKAPIVWEGIDRETWYSVCSGERYLEAACHLYQPRKVWDVASERKDLCDWACTLLFPWCVATSTTGGSWTSPGLRLVWWRIHHAQGGVLPGHCSPLPWSLLPWSRVQSQIQAFIFASCRYSSKC